MQHIQDNKFDQLFKDKFEEAEITPSVNLWAEIETQLVVQPKGVFPVYWIAAAIAVVAVSLGLFLYPVRNAGEDRTDKTVSANADRRREQAAVRSSSTEKPGTAAVKVNAMDRAHALSSADVLSGLKGSTAIAGRKAESETAISPALALEPARKLEDSKKDLRGMQPLALNTHLYKNELIVKQEKLALPRSTSSVGDMVFASTDEGSVRGDEVINENENKGIRNMGDLINYVVDKVDKSDEKVIQFKTDDDNSSLVALNIGIIRFNTKKHK